MPKIEFPPFRPQPPWVDEAVVRKTMLALRADAVGRKMPDLAIAYGWAAIRLGSIVLLNGGVPRHRGWEGYR